MWHFHIYPINGIRLVILSLVFHERIKPPSPAMMKIATVIGLAQASFGFLSGFTAIHGTDAFINRNSKNPVEAETLKNAIETIIPGMGSSDKFPSCLWVALVSIVAIKSEEFLKVLNVFGITISTSKLIGIVMPQLPATIHAFGVGAIIWWLFPGLLMLQKQDLI